MRIMVCGPIAGTGTGKIQKMINFLEKKGFQIINQFSNRKDDYSYIHDFRTRKKLAQKIICHDLECVKKADVFVVLAKPSFGAAIEMFLAKRMKKKVILFSEKDLPSPWPVNFSDIIVKNKNELVKILKKMNNFA